MDYGEKSGMNDPIIHFYETFLGEYNPKLRKARGVWYTPESVVNFIVRACDEVLKDEFGLEDGLTDDSKIKIKVDDKDAGFTKGGVQRQKEIETHKSTDIRSSHRNWNIFGRNHKVHQKRLFGNWSSLCRKRFNT
ncbi:MAG: N-6 DNA methylase [Sulfurimonas sp.]|nr:N-6 DNA methylase [Sulfurimonas sp.]